MSVTLCASMSVLVFSAVASLGTDWQPVDGRLAVLLASSSVFILGGYLFSVMVMRVGDVSFIAPFRYTGLLWALGLGWLVFGDWPEKPLNLNCGVVSTPRLSSGPFVNFSLQNR